MCFSNEAAPGERCGMGRVQSVAENRADKLFAY